jgi:hypothetical protein
MQIQAPARAPGVDLAGVKQAAPPRPVGAVAAAEVPTLGKAAAESGKSFGFVQAGPSGALPAPPPAPQPTGNFTADLINKTIYNKRLASYNKQVAAQRTAKTEAARFGAKESREAALAGSLIRKRGVETAAKLAETRPVRADFATQTEFDTALTEWRKDFGAGVGAGGVTKPEETKESFKSFL